MLPDYRLLAFLSIFVWTVLSGWTGYEAGYVAARTDYAQPMKYRCHEGIVYRSSNGYWEKTSTTCKPLEEIK